MTEINTELAAEQEYKDFMHGEVTDGLRSLVTLSGENSRDHGFHDDWPVDIDLIAPGKDRDLQRAITEKLALIMEEVVEAFGEVRDGRDPLEIYYVDRKGLIGEKDAEYPEQRYDEAGVPQLKPEGLLVEVADFIIRGADLAYLLNGRAALVEAWAVKHEYNVSRPFKHGRQF